jgi:hypothetical protein
MPIRDIMNVFILGNDFFLCLYSAGHNSRKWVTSMNPYLSFRKAVTFKSLFFSIIQMLYKELKWKNIKWTKM